MVKMRKHITIKELIQHLLTEYDGNEEVTHYRIRTKKGKDKREHIYPTKTPRLD